MAAGPEISGEAAAVKTESMNSEEVKKSESESESENFNNVQKLVEMFTKLNPLAKEFFPSSKQFNKNNNIKTFDQFDSSEANYKVSVNDNNPINRRV